MSIIAEELIIQIKATAEGLKESIDAVKTEIEKLKELQKEAKEKLINLKALFVLLS